MTDPGKTSKKGDITLVKEDGKYKTVRLEEMTPKQVICQGWIVGPISN